jgi:molybdate-binding protein
MPRGSIEVEYQTAYQDATFAKRAFLATRSEGPVGSDKGNEIIDVLIWISDRARFVNRRRADATRVSQSALIVRRNANITSSSSQCAN